MTEELTPKERVIEILSRQWQPRPAPELVSVTDALGRVPTRDVFAAYTIPLVRSASMDGWAVKSAFFSQGPPDASVWVLGRDYARADMGDDFDDAFDAVVLVEDVTLCERGPVFSNEVKVVPDLNIRKAGAQIIRGDLLARAGRPLLPKDLAMIQMGGVSVVEVVAKPEIAFIPSGAELSSPGPPPGRGRNIDTNSLLVSKTLE